MPHGVLFRSRAEARIRRYLIESDLLETVIGLGTNLFYGTATPACLLILRKSKHPDWVGKVRIIDGAERFQPGRNQNSLSKADIDALFDPRGVRRSHRSYTAGDARAIEGHRLWTVGAGNGCGLATWCRR